MASGAWAPGVPGGLWNSPTRFAIYATVAVVLGASTFVALDYQGLADYLACPHTCPSSFASDGIDRAPANTTGCQGPVASECYRFDVVSALSGLTLGHVRFNVANPRNGTVDPTAPSIPLGPAAVVSALGPTGQIVGVWSVAGLDWESGSNWSVPTDAASVFVLDSDLTSNSTLADAYLYVYLTDPFNGSIGLPLFCGGC